MTNAELFENNSALINQMWQKRQKIIDEGSKHQFDVNNPGDYQKYHATHTVNVEEHPELKNNPINWAISDKPDVALKPEYDPGSLVFGLPNPRSECWTGHYGIVKGYYLDFWSDKECNNFRILNMVEVDWGGNIGVVAADCNFLKKADIPSNVFDFAMRLAEDKVRKEGVRCPMALGRKLYAIKDTAPDHPYPSWLKLFCDGHWVWCGKLEDAMLFQSRDRADEVLESLNKWNSICKNWRLETVEV
jgi:hypothetical protein